MINVRISLFILIIFLIAVITFTFFMLCNPNLNNLNNSKNLLIINNTTLKELCSVNKTELIENITKTDLILPPQENFLGSINWSNYPLLSNPYIHDYEVSEPTFVIDHPFLRVVLVVEISDTKNKTEVFNQLSDVVLKEREYIGPNSSTTVWGTVDGFWIYYVNMLPNETVPHLTYMP